jgi:hypothetical protein
MQLINMKKEKFIVVKTFKIIWLFLVPFSRCEVVHSGTTQRYFHPPSMIKYAKKIVLRKFNFKINLFSTFNVIKIQFTLHFEIIEHFVEFIVNCT